MDLPPFQLGDHYSFETPEQIDVSYAIAGIGSRFLAALIDSIIIGLGLIIILVPGTFGVTFIIAFILALAGRNESASTAFPFALASTGFLSFCLIAFYYILFETFWHGQSPGKRWIGLRVIREGGYPMTFSTSVIRNIIRLIDFLPVYYMAGLTVMFIDRKSRRLGDLAAGTIVVKEQKGVKLETLDVDRRLLAPAGTTIVDSNRAVIRDVRRLTPDDRRLLRDYLQRRSNLDQESADRIGLSLARAFALKTGHDLEGEPPSQFLDRLAHAIDELPE